MRWSSMAGGLAATWLTASVCGQELVAPNNYLGPPLVAPNSAYATLPTGEPAAPPPIVAPPPQPWTPPPGYVLEPPIAPYQPLACAVEPRSSFWFGSVEMTVLHPSHSVGDAATIDKSEDLVGVRGIVGWESRRGLGLRARIWGSDSHSELSSIGGGPEELDLAAGRFDFDVYRRFMFDHGSLVAGAAVSGGVLELDYDQMLVVQEGGGGAGFFLEMRHAFYETDVTAWSVIARGRWTQLIGEWEESTGSTDLASANSNLQIGEAALGVEYRRKGEYTDFVLQYMLEAQRWDTTFVEDVGFLGSTLSFGFTR